MVGYYVPEFLAGAIAAGFHFHFISEDRRVGGHVLAFEIGQGEVFLDEIKNFELHL